MYSNSKNESILNRIIAKWQRRNKGNFFLLLFNYFSYLKVKIFYKKYLSRQHILSRINSNLIIAEIGVWRGEFSKQLLDYCDPKELVLVDPWKYTNEIRGCAPQVNGKDPMNQKFFDQAYNETYLKFKDNSKVKIYKYSSYDASKLFEDNYFDVIYFF